MAYNAPSGGFSGEISHKLPFYYPDFKNGLIKLTPAPLRVESGSVVATWAVKLAPAESFKVTVEVAKPVDASVMEKFEAAVVNPFWALPVVVSPGFVSPDGSKLLSVSEDFTKIELVYALPPFTAMPSPSPAATPKPTASPATPVPTAPSPSPLPPLQPPDKLLAVYTVSGGYAYRFESYQFYGNGVVLKSETMAQCTGSECKGLQASDLTFGQLSAAQVSELRALLVDSGFFTAVEQKPRFRPTDATEVTITAFDGKTYRTVSSFSGGASPAFAKVSSHLGQLVKGLPLSSPVATPVPQPQVCGTCGGPAPKECADAGAKVESVPCEISGSGFTVKCRSEVLGDCVASGMFGFGGGVSTCPAGTALLRTQQCDAASFMIFKSRGTQAVCAKEADSASCLKEPSCLAGQALVSKQPCSLPAQKGAAACCVIAKPSVMPVPTVTAAPSPSATPAPTPSPTVLPSITPAPTATVAPLPSASPPADFDTLSFTTGERDFPTSLADKSTAGLSYVRISSQRKDAFEFGSARTDLFYYVTDSVAAGFAVQGAVFYQDPVTGNFVKYAHPNAVIEGGKVRVNYVKYRPSPSGASVDLEFLADGIEVGQMEPDFAYFVILVPEKVGAEMRYFMVDVGYGDQPKPHLGSPFEAGVTYG